MSIEKREKLLNKKVEYVRDGRLQVAKIEEVSEFTCKCKLISSSGAYFSPFQFDTISKVEAYSAVVPWNERKSLGEKMMEPKVWKNPMVEMKARDVLWARMALKASQKDANEMLGASLIHSYDSMVTIYYVPTRQRIRMLMSH